MYESINVLSLDENRSITEGSTRKLNEEIRKGAEIRISTGFLCNEHIDVESDDDQLMVETTHFEETVLIDDHWSAYYMTLRQPVSANQGLFGDPSSLSLFLYNQDGRQALARVIMDGRRDEVSLAHTEDGGMAKMHTFSINDADTPGISKNFIYDFEFYRFMACSCYEEIYANDANGDMVSGDIDALGAAYACGRPIKIAFKGLSDVMWGKTGHTDEIYIQCGSSYYYTDNKVMLTNTHPFVSVPADIPMTYKPRSFRYCWLVASTDGRTEVRSYDPFLSEWKITKANLPVRWFAGK